MSNYPLHKTTHLDELIELLPTQFKESTVIIGLLTSLASELQTVENVAQDLFWLMQKNNATLAQLDNIGFIAGEPRNSSTDTAYRSKINARIALNRSSGCIETILDFVSNYGTSIIIELDEFQACVYIFIEPEWTPNALFLASLKKLISAGVAVCVTYVLNSYVPFTFSELNGEDPVGSGFSDAGTGGGFLGTLLV